MDFVKVFGVYIVVFSGDFMKVFCGHIGTRPVVARGSQLPLNTTFVANVLQFASSGAQSHVLSLLNAPF